MQNFLPFSTKNHLKTVIITFIAAFVLFGTTNAYATHALGADLSYTHISGNTYRFSMSFYRDCSGIAAPNIFTATVNGCGNTPTTFTLTQTSGFEDISPTCSAVQSTCAGGTVAGTQRYVYEGIYTFPSICTDWNVSVSHCCRNNNSTVPLASNYDLYVQVNLNNTIANSSPAFAQSPALYACVNQLFSYNNILIDAEGDSLVYALANPLSAANSPINYIAGFNAAQPLSVTAAGFVLDRQTGQLGFTPTTVGQVSILVFEIKEYRNGALISTLRRDVQIIVVNCGANSTPTISSPTNITGATFTAAQNSGNFRVCVGQPMSFNIKTNDVDTTQVLNVLTNVSANFPNAILSIFLGVGNELVINFQWAPTSNDVGTRLLRIESRDNNCPIYGATVNGFTITVVGVKAKASVQTLCKGTPTTINLTADAPTVPNGIYDWTAVPSIGTLPNTQSITVEVTQNTVFTIQYLDNICNATDTVIIKTYGGVTATPAIVANYCPTDAPIQLQAVYSNPAPPLSNCGLGSFSDCTNTPTNHTVGTGTTNTGTTATGGGAGTPFQGFFQDGKIQMLYTANTLTAAGVQAGLITRISFDITSKFSTVPYKNFTIKMGCSNVQEFVAANGFDNNTNAVYSNTAGVSTTLGLNVFNLQTPYRWDGVSSIIVEICFDNTSFSGYDHISVSPTTLNTVLYTRQDNAIGCNLTVATASNALANIVFRNCPIPNAPLFSWSVVPAASGTVSDVNIANPTATAVAAANGTTVRYVVTANDGRCTSKDTVTVAVNCPNCFTNVTIDAPLGTTLNCIQTSLTLNANATGSNGTRSFAWSNGATTTGIVVSNSGIYVVTVTNTLANGNVCTSTQSVIITQDTALPLSILTKNGDLTCINTSVMLSATSNSTNDQFFWNTGETIANIIVNQPNTYTVFVTGTNGCSSSASIAVTQNRVLPIVTIAGNTSFCVGTSTILTADISNGTGTYLWSTGASLAATSFNTAGTYTVTATRTDNGCTASQQRTVSLRLRPNTSITQNPIACIGEPTTLTATGGTAYIWNTGATGAALTLPNPTLTNTYIVTVTGANGCTNIADITLQFLSPGVCVGTENMTDISASIRLFPNPTDTYFNLSFDTQWLDATITVTDMTGRAVLTTQKSLISANETLDFAINDWAAGVYFIDIKNNNQKARLKMVKMR